MPPGRKPLPEGMARTERFTTKLRPTGAEQFRAVCRDLRVTEADALRYAIEDYVKKYGKTTTTRSNR